MGSFGSTFQLGKQQSLGMLSTSCLAPTSWIGHLGALTPPASPKSTNVDAMGDVIVDSPMKHELQAKRVVHESPSKLHHNLQVDVVEGQGCEEHNAQPIASIVPIPISKEINVPQPFNMFFLLVHVFILNMYDKNMCICLGIYYIICSILLLYWHDCYAT